ncbi:MAG: hypothetical protein HYW81_02125 [Parcubacteria group bacterium]|nr:hypothetical protein [Parcubacteria group bacterium]
MSIGTVHSANPAVPLGLQARDMDDAERILRTLLDRDARKELTHPLEEAQRDRIAHDLENIRVLWQSASGRQTLMLDISFSRGHGIR